MRKTEDEISMMEATPQEAGLLDAAAATFQRMVNDAIDIVGSRGAIVMAHAMFSAGAQIVVQRHLSKESYQRIVDLAWTNALDDEAARHKDKLNG